MAGALTTLVSGINGQAVSFLTDWQPLLAWGMGIAFGSSVAVWLVRLVRG